MQPYRSATGDGVVPTRRYPVGATVTAGQIVVAATGAAGLVTDPSANDYTEAVGVTLEAGTYSTTQGTSNAVVKCAYLPNQIYWGPCSGGTAADTAFAETTDGNLLTNTAASAGGTVCTDGDVGTSEFVDGLLICLSGANKGRWRVITAHSDNTSTTVTVPFDSALAVGDTFIRTFAPFNQGLELCTNWEQFNMALGAGVDLPDTGHAVVDAVFLDGFELNDPDYAEVLYPTAPEVAVTFYLVDHVYNSVA